MKLLIVDSEWGAPSPELVDAVQTAVDPVLNHGEGVGLAPIGHMVTVEAPPETTVDVSLSLVLEDGYHWEDVEGDVRAALEAYFAELIGVWADSSELVVRVSQIETRILNITGVLDAADTLINGAGSNLVLSDNAIPVLGAVTDGA